MSREVNNTGKVILCDGIVATSFKKMPTNDLDSMSSLLNGSGAFSAGQKQFSKDFSISLSGNFQVSDSVPANLSIDVYRNGNRLDANNPSIKGSSVLWESLDGNIKRFGEYAQVHKLQIQLKDLTKNSEKIRVTWKSKDEDAVPLSATATVFVGEKVQYALSRFIESSKVSTDSIVWADTINGALAIHHPYSCYLWTRTSSVYDFVNKQYTDWRYFKGDLYYNGMTADDTADGMLDKLNRYIEFSSSTNRFTIDRKSLGYDTIRFGVNINGYTNVRYLWTSLTEGIDIAEADKGKESISINIPHSNNFESVSISVTVSFDEVNGISSKSNTFELSPINVTKPESYIGVLDTIPEGDVIEATQTKAIAGDWFVLRSTNTLYVLDFSYESAESGHWKPFTGDIDNTWPLEKVADAMFDMIEIGNTENTNATMIGVFKALCANSAFITYLKTRNLLVESADKKFSFEVATSNYDGEQYSEPVVKVTYDGVTVFQIAPSSGNVFLGIPNESLDAPLVGFMYNASDKRIISANGNFIINQNGGIVANNGIFSGHIQAGSGSFTGNINATSGFFSGNLESATGIFKGSFITSALESRPPEYDESSGTTITLPDDAQGQCVAIRDKVSSSSYTPCIHSAMSNVYYVKYTLNSPSIFFAEYRYTFYDMSLNDLGFIRETYNSGKYTYDSSISAGTLTLGVSKTDILIFKNIPSSKTGLKSGQIYKNENNQLCIVP